VCHVCGDNRRARSISFGDGTILDWGNSLWEEIDRGIWRGYESEKHKAMHDYRFYLEEKNGSFQLIEYINFWDRRLGLWRSSCE